MKTAVNSPQVRKSEENSEDQPIPSDLPDDYASPEKNRPTKNPGIEFQRIQFPAGPVLLQVPGDGDWLGSSGFLGFSGSEWLPICGLICLWLSPTPGVCVGCVIQALWLVHASGMLAFIAGGMKRMSTGFSRWYLRLLLHFVPTAERRSGLRAQDAKDRPWGSYRYRLHFRIADFATFNGWSNVVKMG